MHARDFRQGATGRKLKAMRARKTVINIVPASDGVEQISNLHQMQVRDIPSGHPTGQNVLETLNILAALIRSTRGAEFTTTLKLN